MDRIQTALASDCIAAAKRFRELAPFVEPGTLEVPVTTLEAFVRSLESGAVEVGAEQVAAMRAFLGVLRAALDQLDARFLALAAKTRA